MYNIDYLPRTERILTWAYEMFGPVATNLDERAARLLEETIELAQSCDVSKEVVLKIVDRVYGKPADHLPQELAGVCMTLDAFCGLLGVDPAMVSEIEYRRVSAFPKTYWEDRHALKVEDGIANLSEVK